MSQNNAPLYEKCQHCHLFIEENHVEPGNPHGLALYIHLHRGDEADEAIIETHDAEPSGQIATIEAWKQFGPVEMLKRFWETESHWLTVTSESDEPTIIPHRSESEALETLRINFGVNRSVPDDEVVDEVRAQGIDAHIIIFSIA